MSALVVGSALACAGCTAALLAGHARESRTLIAVAKAGASASFVVLALAAGATASAYGRLVLVALALSFAGDIALLAPGAGRAFLGGMAAFALAHVAYASAFALLGVSPPWLAAGAALAAAFALAVVRAFGAGAHGHMRLALAAYAFVIAVMLSMATGAFGAGAPWLVLAGAWAFAVSDFFVARHRFGTPGLANKFVGLPLYYAAQVALALSIAAVAAG